MAGEKKIQTAVVGGGCFWCLEAVFSKLKGVRKVTSGYAGGKTPAAEKKPTYEKVSSGRTGHAEAVKIDYDPQEISFRNLLTVFFTLHDPTTPNRQGADIGSQYRSIILFANESQKEESQKFIQKLEKEKIFSKPIVTEIKPLEEFFPAEDYHQRYFEKNPEAPYCQLVIAPKMEKSRKRFEKLTQK